MLFFDAAYDVAVIGAGHAGIEAGLAAARLGCKTAVFTINMDWVGNMPCNPSIGGTAKGHLVREIDALGGEMGKAADATFLQSRMLNRGKGPAVHSLRAQIDRRDYSAYMKAVLEKTDNLDLRQGEITAIERGEDGNFRLTTRLEAQYSAKAVILATGTFLRGRIFVGDVSYEGGPDGMFAATALTDCLLALGIGLQNFPEGSAVSLPLRREGLSPSKSFFWGQLSGMVEPLAALAGAFMAVYIRSALPVLLSFAAGAMIYVVVEELIPESQSGNRPQVMALFTLVGFTVMMIMDVALG